MSGGSLDYVFSRVQDAAGEIRRNARIPLHRAFATHLDKVAKALYDLEWVMSGDYGEGQELESIMACIGKTATLTQVTKEARDALIALQTALDGLQESSNKGESNA